MINFCKGKKTIFSAIQPSGTITLGNYLGALKNWVEMQNDFNCIYALADLHTITVRQDPKTFERNLLEAYALLMACGIDTTKTLFFIQSQVSAHSQLAWMLNCYTQFGELSRMTQFKQKSKQHEDNINLGLFSYPVLQAADILLYNADMVPIGADQKQHLELTRNIAQRFNNIYGNVFKVPEPYVPDIGARISSLQDPTRKMSKSDPNENSYIALLDPPDVITKKLKRAVTDSDNIIKFSENKPGISNLIRIYSIITNTNIEKCEQIFEGKGYGEFKIKVAEVIIEHLVPIQKKFERYISDMPYIKECYVEAARQALEISEKTLANVQRKIGFVL